jgi:hypothetical protein
MKNYTIKLTKKQAETVMTACEVLARLGIGQFRDALEHLPLQRMPVWSEDLQSIGKTISRYTKHNIDGWQSSLSIHSADTSDEAKTAWDIHQVIRHKLSWRRAIDDGIVATDDPASRDWDKMGGRCFDEPSQIGPDLLPEMEGVN